ncbi:Hsp70 family protein [Kitasatospora arboriphila]
MAAPVLVVDFGTSSSAAAVVTDRGERLVKEPSSGLLSWPSAVSVGEDGRLLVGSAAENRKRAEPGSYRAEFKRDLGERAPVPLGGRLLPVTDLVAAVLAEFRSQGRTVTGTEIDRLVVTVPASYGPVDPRREAMLAAGRQAGFRSVELLAEPVAAAHAAVAGEPFAPGQTVLVYDFGGGTFDTALVRIGPDGMPEVLGHTALDDCGGRDIDALLAGRIRERGRDWLEPLLGAGGAGALRARLELGDFVRRLKHQLTEAGQVEDYLTPLGPASRVARGELEELVGPLLDRTVACCRQLLADHAVRTKDVDAVLLVGGTTRIPAVRALLTERLNRPLRLVEDPDLAVVHGAAAWAARAADRRLVPVEPPAHTRPLAWTFPAASAELTGWTVDPGTDYPAGGTLGSVRLPDGSLWELTADGPGTVVGQLARPGAVVGPGEWLLAVQPLGAPPPAPGGTAPPPAPDRPAWPGRTRTAVLALLAAVPLGYGLLGLAGGTGPVDGLLLLIGYAALVALVAGSAAAVRGVPRSAARAVPAALALALAGIGWAADLPGGRGYGYGYSDDYAYGGFRTPFDEGPLVYGFEMLGLLLLGTAAVAAALALRRKRRAEASVDWRSWLGGLVGAVLAAGATGCAVLAPRWEYGASLAQLALLVLLPCLAAAAAAALLVRGLLGGRPALARTALVSGLAALAAMPFAADLLVRDDWVVVLAGALAAAGGAAGLALAAEAPRTRASGLPAASWCALLFAGLAMLNGAL